MEQGDFSGMTATDIQAVAVIGAGTMGTGIAQVCAQAGLDVYLFDPISKQLERAHAAMHKQLAGAVERGKMSQAEADATVARVTFIESLDDLPSKDGQQPQLAIEAIIESLDAKREIFQDLAQRLGPSAILATNTSSIPITRIASHIAHPERVVGLHFFVPAALMKLVEVIRGAVTSQEVADLMVEFAKRLGKTPVQAADAPGFIVNRVARPYYVESLLLMEEGVADFETIDACLENFGFKMGAFRLMDLIGVDSNFLVTSSMHELFHGASKFRPSRIQQQKVDAGHYGRKSGKGFYDYSA